MTAYIQAQELSGRTVTVELTSKPAGEAGKNQQGKVEGTERVTLGNRAEVVPVKFEITPGDTGRRTLRVEVKSPPEDNNASDNVQEADVEIVDRRTRVLLLASGPTREYTFVRNLLRRDKEVIVDVYLQSGQPGISQDANSILEHFPASPQELFEYDAIVGFDPDWLDLDADEIDLVERWVAEKAGGMIVIAGPVETDRWAQDTKMGKMRALYPVEFNRRMAMLDDGKFGSETPWPVEFTREGRRSRILVAGRQRAGQPASLGLVPGRVRLLRRSWRQTGGHGLRPLFRSGKCQRRPVARVHGRPLLRIGPCVLFGQWRAVAAACN